MKFFSSTTVLVSGLMRFTSNRPTWKRHVARYQHCQLKIERGKKKVKNQCEVCDDVEAASALKIKVNKSAPLILFFSPPLNPPRPIIHADAEYRIERCAPLFKISPTRKWALLSEELQLAVPAACVLPRCSSFAFFMDLVLG